MGGSGAGQGGMQPDWDRIAEGFDLWLPQLAPAGEAVVEALAAALGPGEGRLILDLACGTGEPALSVARRLPGDRVVGVDAAPGMLRAMRRKARRARLAVDAVAGRGEALPLAAGRADGACSRFGLMLFDDPPAAARELRRVLRPGAPLALAVWKEFPTLAWAWRACRSLLPEERLPPWPKAVSLGEPARLEAVLAEAGFREVRVREGGLSYRFPSFAAYWEAVLASGIMDPQLGALDQEGREAVREAIAREARPFEGLQGLAVPHRFLVATARR